MPPELVNVADWVRLLPSCTFPKSMLDGATESCPGANPEPETGTVTVVMVLVVAELLRLPLRLPGFAVEAVLTREIVPLSVPPEGGVKLTLIIALCPAVRVSGKLTPLKLKPVPVTVAWDMVTSEPPELVNVAGCV